MAYCQKHKKEYPILAMCPACLSDEHTAQCSCISGEVDCPELSQIKAAENAAYHTQNWAEYDKLNAQKWAHLQEVNHAK